MHGLNVGVWRSPVARLLWEQDVEGSNPFTPTKNFLMLFLALKICFAVAANTPTHASK